MIFNFPRKVQNDKYFCDKKSSLKRQTKWLEGVLF